MDASSEAVRTQLDAELAKAARLAAEQSGAAQIVFPPELTKRGSDPRVIELLKHESSVFRVRRDHSVRPAWFHHGRSENVRKSSS